MSSSQVIPGTLISTGIDNGNDTNNNNDTIVNVDGDDFIVIDDDDATEMEEIARIVTNSPNSTQVEETKNYENPNNTIISNPTSNKTHSRNNILLKLENLSKILGSKTAKESNEGFSTIDPIDFDFHKILQSYLKSATEQGIHLRSTGVIFKNLTTIGIDAESSFATTSTDVLLAPLKIFAKFKEWRNTKTRKIIQNISGIVKPGELCLVLGRPGSGCSTLLKSIAGEQDQFIKVEGEINYDGIPQHEMMKKYKSDVIYNGELEFHYPHLTVDQTLRFAIACKTPHTRVNNTTRDQYIKAERDLLATIFGLTHTYNTKVGNDFIRGVSGGERKRVSIAEAMACKATVYCWDNATRGLDSSTALEYAEAIRTSTNLTKSVALVTIYQAGDNIYEKFDKVLILYEGREVYFGPAQNAKKYFENMGFQCPSRQAIAEYLTAVTDPQGRFPKPGYENKVPRTAEEFETYWHNSLEYLNLTTDINNYESNTKIDDTRDLYNKSLAQEKMRVHNRYTITFLEQLKLLTVRGVQRISGDRTYTIIHNAAAIFQALVLGSMYWNTPNSTAGAFSRGGVLFFSLLYFSLMGLAGIAGQFNERPILLKQKSYSLFHPGAETLGSLIANLPFKLLSIICFFIPIYFLSNLARDAGKFFLNLLFLIVTSESITGLFQMVASLSQSFTSANAIAGLLVIMIAIYNGYMVQLKSMHPWFKWISYINPVRYGYENLMAVEFHGRKMDCQTSLVPSGPGYNFGLQFQSCAFVGSKAGQDWVSGNDYIEIQYSYKYDHIWRNFGIIVAFLVFFTVVTAVATEYKRPVKGGGDHLYFKKSRLLAKKKLLPRYSRSHNDVESGEATTVKTEDYDDDYGNSTEEIFEDLKSTGIFAWKNVDYVIPYKGSTRKLLDDINGYVKPGTLTALMGESGAGKTTLLNVLSHRVDFGTITGDFLVNGKPLDMSFRRSTGYVQQQDLHIEELTVRESLRFAARLRRPASVPDEEKLDYVEKIIKVLGMQSYSEAIVGTLGAGLNVEQRKKLSIGVELVAKPSLLLFLDEPTSGLDSQSAWAIVALLKKLAASGQSILCTIHQPSATLFESFDRLLMLKKGGKTVYFGDIGHNSRTILDYFERNGSRHCGHDENPAEYILEAIGAGATASIKTDWYDIWTKSPEYKNIVNEVDELITRQYEENEDLNNKELHAKFAMPYKKQLRYVIIRTATQLYRDPNYIFSKLVLFIFGGLFIGFTFWNLNDSVLGLQSAMFATFMSIVISAPAMNQIQSRAIDSRELFEVRESNSNTFHWSALLFAQFINEMPYHLLLGAIFFCCMYFPMGIFREASRAGVYYLNYGIIFQMFYVSLGLLVIYISPNLASSAVIGGLLLSMLIAFCGVVQPLKLMPGFWHFMYKVSPYTYLIQNFVSIVIHEKPVVCAEDEITIFDSPNGLSCYQYAQPFVNAVHGYLINPNATSACEYCVYSVGDQFLATVGIKFGYIWRNFGFLWAYISFDLIAMCVVYYIFRVVKFSPIKLIKGKLDSFRHKDKKTHS
ncbi:hypothetical protein WICMUC_005567 [Wickerhamomyces mucosus]|uniref:ABC transporter domain-containing protein n=1 Tax=Wickerhamomyces mucosus TaxID=1378264 RepID=A0A9P8P7W1_9ASCO|nr:hypothetical protein WICMUC_005567 [Wickerhamomyces mucosus]